MFGAAGGGEIATAIASSRVHLSYVKTSAVDILQRGLRPCSSSSSSSTAGNISKWPHIGWNANKSEAIMIQSAL
jgi:hypothetical protein